MGLIMSEPNPGSEEHVDARPTVYGLPRRTNPMADALRDLANKIDRGDLQVACGDIAIMQAPWIDGGSITVTSDLVLVPVVNGA